MADDQWETLYRLESILTIITIVGGLVYGAYRIAIPHLKVAIDRSFLRWWRRQRWSRHQKEAKKERRIQMIEHLKMKHNHDMDKVRRDMAEWDKENKNTTW